MGFVDERKMWFRKKRGFTKKREREFKAIVKKFVEDRNKKTVAAQREFKESGRPDGMY